MNDVEEIVLQTLESVKINHINYVLMMCDYNQKLASEKLDIAPKTLQNFLKSNKEISNKIKHHKNLNKIHAKGIISSNEDLADQVEFKFRKDDFKETGYRDPSPEERDHWYNMNYCY